jgi:hypothetical protein
VPVLYCALKERRLMVEALRTAESKS